MLMILMGERKPETIVRRLGANRKWRAKSFKAAAVALPSTGLTFTATRYLYGASLLAGVTDAVLALGLTLIVRRMISLDNFLFFLELQSSLVYAITLTSWFWAVVKNMAQVRAATIAFYLNARHA